MTVHHADHPVHHLRRDVARIRALRSVDGRWCRHHEGVNAGRTTSAIHTLNGKRKAYLRHTIAIMVGMDGLNADVERTARDVATLQRKAVETQHTKAVSEPRKQWNNKAKAASYGNKWSYPGPYAPYTSSITGAAAAWGISSLVARR